MPRIQILEPAPDFGSQLGAALGGGIGKGLGQSVGDFFKDKAQRRKKSEEALRRLPKEAEAYLKAARPSYSKGENFRQVLDKAKKYLDRSESTADAVEKAIKELNPKEANSGKGGAQKAVLEALNGSSRDMESSGFFSDSFLEGPKEKFSIERALDVLKSPFSSEHPTNKFFKEKTGSALGHLGLGTVAPIEELVHYADPLQAALEVSGVGKRPPLLSEQARERLNQGLSPEQQKQGAKLESLGGMIPIERAIAALGKLPNFVKNVSKFASAERVAEGAALERMTELAKQEGISLEKLAAGDKKEAGKFYNFSNRLATQGEKKAARTFREAPKANPKHEALVREAQVKAYPRYAEEVAEDATKIDRYYNRNKLPETQLKELNAVKVARNSLGDLERASINAGQRRRSIEDSLEKYSGIDLERVRALHQDAIAIEKKADKALKDAIFQSETGRTRPTSEGLEEQISESLKKVEEHAADVGKKLDESLFKPNPERLKRAAEIQKRKIPGEPYRDTYMDVKSHYEKAYDRRLGEIKEELGAKGSAFLPEDDFKRLAREKTMLEERLKGIKADKTIHEHEQRLRQLAKAKGTQQKLEKLKPAQGNEKISNLAREAIKNPVGKGAEELAKSAGVSKENLKEAVQDFSKEFGKKAEQAKKMSSAQREFNRFWEEIKNKEYFKAFMKTPMGREILVTVGAVLTEEFIGKEFPYASLATAAVGERQGTRWVRTALLLVYRKLRDEMIKESYRKAYRSHDEEKIFKIKKEHPRLAKKVEQDLD